MQNVRLLGQVYWDLPGDAGESEGDLQICEAGACAREHEPTKARAGGKLGEMDERSLLENVSS